MLPVADGGKVWWRLDEITFSWLESIAKDLLVVMVVDIELDADGGCDVFEGKVRKVGRLNDSILPLVDLVSSVISSLSPLFFQLVTFHFSFSEKIQRGRGEREKNNEWRREDKDEVIALREVG